MSVKYPDLSYTLFPNAIDPMVLYKDVDLSVKPYIDSYYQKYNAGDFEGANQVIVAHPELKDYMVNAETMQRLHDSNVAVQRAFSNEIVKLFASIIKYQNEFNPAVEYDLYDMFYHKGIAYMVIDQNVPARTYPPNTKYYVQLAIVGASGTGLSFDEDNWKLGKIYSKNICVCYNNRLWVSRQDDNVDNEPLDGSDYWKCIVTVPRQIVVSEDQPSGQTTGDIWFEYKDGKLKINEKINSGYRILLPLLTADSIQYTSSESVAQALNNHFLASNPHNISHTEIGAAASNHLHDERYYTKTQVETNVTAASAKKLSTARTINEVGFDGTKNISINRVTNPLAIDVAGLRNIVIREEDNTLYVGEGVVELVLK